MERKVTKARIWPFLEYVGRYAQGRKTVSWITVSVSVRVIMNKWW